MNLARVGLIVNPSAGRGDALIIARETIRALAPQTVLVGNAEMGADALRDLPVVRRIFDWSAQRGKARTTWLAQHIAQENPDALVVIGGDGTFADVALAQFSSPASRGKLGGGIPILGIGAGSANVGPLVTCRSDETKRLTNARFTTRAVNGLIAGANKVDLGLGFNDVVIDFTVLATVNDRMMNVDAAQKMSGRNVPRDPMPVWTERTRVWKKSPRGETLIAQGDQVATVIVGLPDERFFGKAITGGVILSGLLDEPAGCLACSHLLVRTSLDAEVHHGTEPVVSRYVGIREGESILGSGFHAGVALCADGNPLKILDEDDCVLVRVERGLATSIQISS